MRKVKITKAGLQKLIQAVERDPSLVEAYGDGYKEEMPDLCEVCEKDSPTDLGEDEKGKPAWTCDKCAEEIEKKKEK